MTIRPNSRRGSTLVEVVLGMAVSAVLLGALSSAMIITTKAMPDGSSPLKATTDAALAIDQMADELLVATSIPTRTPNAIEFTVADRNGDNVPETIRYEWSGTTGDPLRRMYNAGSWVEILGDIRQLELTYETYVDNSSPSTPTQSGETILAGYTSKNSPNDWPLKDKEWIGQYFVPALPAEATSWQITRARILVRSHGGDGGIGRLQLRAADGAKKPTGPILAESTFVEKEMPDRYVWNEISFSGASGLAPGAGYCLILQWVKDFDACDVQFESSRAAVADSAMLTTIDSGASWAVDPTRSILFEVHGKYSAPSVTPPSPPTFVTGVRIKLRAGDSTSSEIETRIPVLNEPRI